MEMPLLPPSGRFSSTNITRSGSGYGSGWSSMALKKLNIAVFAPIESAIVAIAIAAKPGLERSVRRA